jgi:tetratricopeptide (TPR) repeat protein
LEAAGIRTAVLPLDDDFITAFSLGIDKSQAETLFYGTDKILVIDGEIWLPLSMAAFNEGFMKAWNRGAEGLASVFAAGQEVDFVVLEEAWALYPPAPLPAQGIQFKAAEPGLLLRNAETALSRYAASEINPLIQAVQAQIRTAPTAALQNRLGVLLVRAGRTVEAKAAYERAAGMGSVPAMTNRGNMALADGDLAGAERWFAQALAASPNNITAKQGLEQIRELRR